MNPFKKNPKSFDGIMKHCAYIAREMINIKHNNPANWLFSLAFIEKFISIAATFYHRFAHHPQCLGLLGLSSSAHVLYCLTHTHVPRQ
jgi:hypothetical protein